MLISAKEARIKSKEILEKGLTKELKEIETLISNAINDGKCEIFISGALKQETKTQLNNLGYEIEEGGRFNETDTFIRW